MEMPSDTRAIALNDVRQTLAQRSGISEGIAVAGATLAGYACAWANRRILPSYRLVRVAENTQPVMRLERLGRLSSPSIEVTSGP